MAADILDVHPLDEVLLAAEFPEPKAELGRADFLLLHRAGASGVLTPEMFATVLLKLRKDGSLVHASRENFDWALDYLYGYGFRDAALPHVSLDYRDFLSRWAQVLDIPDGGISAVAEKHGSSGSLKNITGEAFGFCLFYMFIERDMAIPPLPARRHMTRATMGWLQSAARDLGLSHAEHQHVVMTFGGGCLRARDLDRRGMNRVLSRYLALGWLAPEPAPRVAGRAGYVSQPQVNLIWKLARDIGLKGATQLNDWLSVVAGVESGLPTLTQAGARYVIDRMLGQAIVIRDLREKEVRERQSQQVQAAMAALAA